MSRPRPAALLRCAALLGTLALPTGSEARAAPSAPALRPVLVRLPGDDARAQLLGAWDGRRWLSDEQTFPRLTGKTAYVAQGLRGAPVTVRASAPRHMGAANEPCDRASAVDLRPVARGTAGAGLDVLTRPGGPPTRPRPVTALPTTSGAYREAVRTELRRLGLRNPDVRLTGVYRTDLDGNGTQEVLLEASLFHETAGKVSPVPLSPPPVGQPGDYSVLLLRQVVNGRVRTEVLGHHIAPGQPWDPGSGTTMPMASLYRLAGVADLNGDGRMELVVYSAYYEGYALAALTWSASVGARGTALDTGCGV